MHSIQLSIPTPCHQNWDNMTPTEQGRFCNACAKQVVDFTTMSDGKVLNYFKTKKDENVCGRTLPNQLNRILEAPKPIVPNKLWYWKYAAAAGLLLMGREGVAQSKIISICVPIENPFKRNLQEKVGEISTLKISKIITGKVTDVNGETVPFASIKIKNRQIGVSADVDGAYSIEVNINNDVLQISSAGYKMKELNILNSLNGNITLEKTNIITECIVVGYLGMINVNSQKALINFEQNNIAIIKIIDTITKKIITDATLYFKEEDDDKFDTIQLKNGQHKIKHIKKDEIYTIQASKEGYVSKAIEISCENFNSRKGVFEIYLTKKENDIPIRGNTFIRMGGVTSINKSPEPLYVIDGTPVINFKTKTFNTNLIENVNVLKASTAQILYGSIAANGAIIITTKKQKVKKDTLPTPIYELMDEVVVKGDVNKKIISHMLGSVTVVSEEMLKCTKSGINIKAPKTDTIKQKILNLFSPLKVFPNPVKKGELLTVTFPNKDKLYMIQIINAAGVVVLQNKRQDGFKPSDAYIKTITQQLPISNTWSNGYYLINILNEQGKPIAKSSFLVL